MSDVALGKEILSAWTPWSVVSLLVTVLVFGQIVKRAGYSRWWSLLTLLPLVGNIAHIVFAFAPWPVESPRRRKKR